MKKLMGVIVVLTLLVSCSSKEGSNSSPLDYLQAVSSTDLQAETGGPIALGMSAADITGKRGEPKFKGTMPKGELVMKYEDYQYSLAEDKVIGYSFEVGALSGKQVKIGDSEEQVLKAYGEHCYKRTIDKMDFLGYLDKENKKVIEFVMNGAKVQMILVSDFSLFSQ